MLYIYNMPQGVYYKVWKPMISTLKSLYYNQQLLDEEIFIWIKEKEH